MISVCPRMLYVASATHVTAQSSVEVTLEKPVVVVAENTSPCVLSPVVRNAYAFVAPLSPNVSVFTVTLLPVFALLYSASSHECDTVVEALEMEASILLSANAVPAVVCVLAMKLRKVLERAPAVGVFE